MSPARAALAAAAAVLAAACSIRPARFSPAEVRSLSFSHRLRCEVPPSVSKLVFDGTGQATFTWSPEWQGDTGKSESKTLEDLRLRVILAEIRRSGVKSAEALGRGETCYDCCTSDIVIRTASGGTTKELTFKGYLEFNESWKELVAKIDEIVDLSQF